MKLTAIISKGEEYFIGQVKELPGVLTQGQTVAETKKNLLDALSLWLKDAEEEVDDVDIIYQEELHINVG